MEADSAERPIYVSDANPKVAAVSELAQPWSSKKFFFRSLTLSRYVPALIVRLPGPASREQILLGIFSASALRFSVSLNISRTSRRFLPSTDLRPDIPWSLIPAVTPSMILFN